MWWEPVSFFAPFRRWKAPRSCFSFCRRLTPASLLQSPILVEPLAINRRSIQSEHWQSAELRSAWTAGGGCPCADGRGRPSLHILGCFRFATALAEALDQQIKHGDK